MNILLACYDHFLYLQVLGMTYPWILLKAFQFQKDTLSFWWWLIDRPNMPISCQSNILLLPTVLPRLFWIMSLSYMGFHTQLSLIGIRYSYVSFGRSCSNCMTPNFWWAQHITHKWMARLKESTSVWRCTYAVQSTILPKSGASGFPSQNYGTILHFTQPWVVHHSKLSMVMKHGSQWWPRCHQTHNSLWLNWFWTNRCSWRICRITCPKHKIAWRYMLIDTVLTESIRWANKYCWNYNHMLNLQSPIVLIPSWHSSILVHSQLLKGLVLQRTD